jgi:hypothetical protein
LFWFSSEGEVLFPDPAQNEFKLRTAAPIGYGISMTIQNMFGRTVVAKDFAELDYEVVFDNKTLANGTYMVSVTSDEGQAKVFRLVVHQDGMRKPEQSSFRKTRKGYGTIPCPFFVSQFSVQQGQRCGTRIIIPSNIEFLQTLANFKLGTASRFIRVHVFLKRQEWASMPSTLPH